MFRFLCKKFLHSTNGYTLTAHNPSSIVVVSLSMIRCFSIDSADNSHSFTVSYLTKTCGLSPKSALSASKSVHFESPDKPDLVLSCFQKFGFSKTDISEMIRKFPKILCCHPNRTISPKVDFFRSKGTATSNLVKIFTVNPWILKPSLENQLVPNFNILIDMFQSEDKAMEVIKKNPHVLCMNGARLIPNINTLRENGVAASVIFWLFCNYWRCIDVNPVGFRKTVEEVKEMGFDPLKSQFVEAMRAFTSLGKSKWDGKVEVYKRWGWSDDDITTAFKKFPNCMMYSEDKIMGAIDFYVNKLGLESSVVVNSPVLLSYSLKKRLIPRGVVIQFLSSKGLVKLDSSIGNMLIYPEKRFLGRYVKCHEEAPLLIKMYNEKLHEATNQ